VNGLEAWIETARGNAARQLAGDSRTSSTPNGARHIDSFETEPCRVEYASKGPEVRHEIFVHARPLGGRDVVEAAGKTKG